MKRSIGIAAVAFFIVAFACWCTANMVFHHIKDFGGESYPLPYFTRLLLEPYGWLLLCPLPFALVAIILAFRRNLRSRTVMTFTGAAIVAMVLLISAVSFASVLPVMSAERTQAEQHPTTALTHQK